MLPARDRFQVLGQRTGLGRRGVGQQPHVHPHRRHDCAQVAQVVDRPFRQAPEIPRRHVERLARATLRLGGGHELGGRPRPERSPDRAEESRLRIDPPEQSPQTLDPGAARLGGRRLQPPRHGRDPHALVQEPGLGRAARDASPPGRFRRDDRRMVQRHEPPRVVEDRAARRPGLGIADVMQHHVVGHHDVVVAQSDLLRPPSRVLDDVDDIRRSGSGVGAVQGDRPERFQAQDAAEGEVQLGLGHEQKVGSDGRLDRPVPSAGLASGVLGLIKRQGYGLGGRPNVGQDVVVGQEHIGRDQESRPARAVPPPNLHHGSPQAVPHAEEVEREQAALAQDQLGSALRRRGLEREPPRRAERGVHRREESAVERGNFGQRSGHRAGPRGSGRVASPAPRSVGVCVGLLFGTGTGRFSFGVASGGHGFASNHLSVIIATPSRYDDRIHATITISPRSGRIS